MNKILVSIVTPTFNRSQLLKKVFESLNKQKTYNFEWIIIDDGSTDNTQKIVTDFIKKKNKFTINYLKQNNFGKHIAVNKGIKEAKGKLALILDSDDQLTDDAIQKIDELWAVCKNKNFIAGLSFLKKDNNNFPIGKVTKNQVVISNHIDFRYNKGFLGDRCEVYRTEIMKKFPFPKFEEEKFLSEAIVWNTIAKLYQTMYINEAIQICEYLKNGLSDNSLKLRKNNPYGVLANAEIFMEETFKISIRIKNAIIYNAFFYFLKNKKTINKELKKNKILLKTTKIPGILLYWYIKFQTSST